MGAGHYWSSTKQKVTVKMQAVLDLSMEKKEIVHEWLTEALDRDPDYSNHSDDSTDSSSSGR